MAAFGSRFAFQVHQERRRCPGSSATQFTWVRPGQKRRLPLLSPDNAVPVAAGASWHVEKDADSVATVMNADGTLKFDYTLAGSARRSQFAAAVERFPASGAERSARSRFR